MSKGLAGHIPVKKMGAPKGTISRVLYPSLSQYGTGLDDGHSSRTLITQGLKRPTRPASLPDTLRHREQVQMGCSNPRSRQGSGTYSVLLRVGFTKLSRSLGILVSSYLAFSPLPPKRSKELFRAVCFLLHFPWGRPRSLLATTLPCGARTFLRKSSFPAAI